MIEVTRLDSGDWMVWGTRDVEEARQALLAEEEFMDWVGMRHVDEHPEVDVDVVLVGVDPNLFRKNPCHPNSCWEGGSHGWHLGWARKPGHGARPGVLVGDFALVPQEFESDDFLDLTGGGT